MFDQEKIIQGRKRYCSRIGINLGVLIRLKKGCNIMFQESMIIPSLYTRDDQEIIERWIEHSTIDPERDSFIDANRVAEIALSSVQGRLPQGISIKADGSPVIGRKTWNSQVPMRNNLLFPTHLLDINWDDSQPGFSWPESYYATFFPGYNLYAVTVSQGSCDSNGYYDLAIGSFQVEELAEIEAKASLVVQAWWQSWHQGMKKCGWKELLKSGQINAGTALQLCDEVWNKVVNP